MRPLVSVLLPVYRPRPDYLHLALFSLVNQTFHKFEILLVEAQDQEGPHHTLPFIPSVVPKIIKELDDPRLRYLPFSGAPSLVDQLNFGMEQSHGPLIARMDADDWSHPNRLSEQVDFLANHKNVAVVGTQIDVMDADDRPLGYRCYPTEPHAVAQALRRYNALAHPSVMYRKDVILSAGGYRNRYPGNEDYELWCRLAAGGQLLANHSRRLLRYRIHQGAVKSKKLRSILRGTRLVKSHYFHGKMTLHDRTRYCAEGLLLTIPSRWVFRLFQRLQYHTD